MPGGPGADIWIDQLATEGPMARTIDDTALMLSVITLATLWIMSPFKHRVEPSRDGDLQ